MLKNVYHNREQDILLKQTLKKEETWLRDHEKAQIDADVEAQNRAHEEKALRIAYEKKTH